MGMMIEEYESSDLMTENEFLRKQLAEALKHRRMFEADYENRLKADMVAMLKDLQSEIEECVDGAEGSPQFEQGVDIARAQVVEMIQQKINELEGESEGEE